MFICVMKMNRCYLKLAYLKKFHNFSSLKKLHSDSKQTKYDLKRIRNIGILAHIDAGKTTTTERMLYYSGTINRMGEVHRGDTITDYLEQERDRGITITSASVTIPWLNHRINIIDTPGHIDFTYEVEQSLNVIDGAIIILDGSQGVEAQTLTVWRQADKYQIPRIVYVNKMDRLDSSFDMCMKSLETKFEREFLPLQVPLRGEKTGISSIVDIISKDILTWSGEQGDIINRKSLPENNDLTEKIHELRRELVDKLSGVDDALANIVLEKNSLDDVGVVPIYDALRRVTLSHKMIPVLCGSSYKNIGVQKLMDAVVDILPSPDMKSDSTLFEVFDENLCARAFKVVHDQRRGAVTFFRIYSGVMTKNQKIYNVTEDKNEQVQRLMVALADEYEEAPEITAGNIAAATGLKFVFSGNTITNNESVIKKAISKLSKKKHLSESESRTRLCPPARIPDPVFFQSIEAPSMAYQAALDQALEQLQREDPSLQVKLNPDTGQTILGGMGELHLEIVKDRILKTYKIDADLGPLQIAYKEFLTSSATETHTSDVTIRNVHHIATISMSIFPRKHENQEFIVLDKTPENVPNTNLITPRQLMLIKNGIESALPRGPKIGCPVINACFMVHNLLSKRFTPDSVLTSAAAHCVQKLLSQTNTILMEPVMDLEVITDEKNMPLVMSDLSRKRSDILDFTTRGQSRIVKAVVPLAELLGYSKNLRITTSGNASFTMEFKCYKEVSGVNEAEAIKDITGFYPV
ncbi:ribosome-releasing factor 2, mitochondrial [Planococcus citri]|uniref:ribosome-releasing factor 2, mitochondrial n=1 Tax=Planococcus citri TaxID=170843 RepID=UPI0031F7815A